MVRLLPPPMALGPWPWTSMPASPVAHSNYSLFPQLAKLGCAPTRMVRFVGQDSSQETDAGAQSPDGPAPLGFYQYYLPSRGSGAHRPGRDARALSWRGTSSAASMQDNMSNTQRGRLHFQKDKFCWMTRFARKPRRPSATAPTRQRGTAKVFWGLYSQTGLIPKGVAGSISSRG